jgi:hypothetical protein
MEQPEEMPVEAPAEEEELKPEEPAEEERKEFECPNCGTIIDLRSERCWACEAKLRDGKLIEAPKKKESHRPEPKKEEPKPIEEPVEEEKHAEEPEEKAAHKEPDEVHKEPEEEKRSEVKRSVSIRKIIKRK